MNSFKFLFVLMALLFCAQSNAYVRRYDVENVVTFETEVNRIREISDKHYHMIQFIINIPMNNSDFSTLQLNLSEISKDNNQTLKICREVGDSWEQDKTISLYLFNGEILTSNRCLVTDNRVRHARNDLFGIVGSWIRLSELRSNMNSTSTLSKSSKEKYFAQKLREHPIKKIEICGYTYYVSTFDTAKEIDGLFDVAEKAAGRKCLTFKSSTTLPANNNTGSTSASRRSSSSYLMPKSTMYGSVRYITPRTTSSLSHLRNHINTWGECCNGAFTSGKGVAVYSGNGHATTGLATGFVEKLKEITANKYVIDDVNISSKGYVVIYGGNGYAVNGVPPTFLDALKKIHEANEYIKSAVFNDSGRWAVITDKNYWHSDYYVKDYFAAAVAKYGPINSFFISANGAMIACCANGIYYKDVPSNVIEKIRELDFIPKVVKFTDDGLYLITDGNSRYTYFL